MRVLRTMIALLMLSQTADVVRAQGLSPTRFLAAWADGTRSTGYEVLDWSWADKQPRLGDRLLFDSGGRVRWLRDTTLEIVSPPAFIEFVGGDRFPGKLVSFAAEQSLPALPTPVHLLVEPLANYDRPATPTRNTIRILPQFLRRIVWEPRGGDHYRPGTALCRDGRLLDFRSLRWQPTGVRVLNDSGTQTLVWEELAELHLPQLDHWESLYQQRAILSPSARSPLLRVADSQGLLATTSTERFQAISVGRESDPKDWYHIVQPAWSLDALYVPHRRIRQRTFFALHEVPLTLLTPLRSSHRSVVSSAWTRPQLDASVQGTPLVSGQDEYGWGLGVHAQHELEFEIAAEARTFRTKVGLDQLSGTGGCARALVYHGSLQSEPLFESPLLIGSQTVFDTQRMALAPSLSGRSRLILVADAVHKPPVRGADPLDVRDLVDWLEPMLELNPEEAYQTVMARRMGALREAEGWKIVDAAWNDIKLSHVLYPHAFRPVLQGSSDVVSLEHTLTAPSPNARLVIWAGQPPRPPQSGRIAVSIDGQAVYEGALSVIVDPTKVTPLSIPVPEGAKSDRQVRIRFSLPPTGQLDWRGAAILAAP